MHSNLITLQIGDDTFEERRRKGLVRFINSVARHPVLGKDEVVVAFLSHPSVRPLIQMNAPCTHYLAGNQFMEKSKPALIRRRIRQKIAQHSLSRANYTHGFR